MTAERLAERLLEDRKQRAGKPTPRICDCFLCGRSYMPKADDSDDSTRFCSDLCREAYDAGAAPTRDSDPFAVDRWRVIAGPPPGYTPKAPLRLSRQGSWINCLHCKREFESKGLRCCSLECERGLKDRAESAAMLAEVGGSFSEKRKCESCGGPIPNWVGEGVKRRRTPKSRRTCSARCQRKVNKTGGILTSNTTETACGPPEPSEPFFGPSTPPLNLVGGYRWPGAPQIDMKVEHDGDSHEAQ